MNLFYTPIRAFTLLEVLIYMALLVMMISVLFTSSRALQDAATFVQSNVRTVQDSLDNSHAADEGVHHIL